MNAVYLNIAINGIDVRPYVTSFRFEDCVDEDNSLELVMSLPLETVNDLYENAVFDAGAEVECSFGFLAGLESEKHICSVVDVSRAYKQSGDVEIRLTALDSGTAIKRGSQGNKIWEDVTSTDIVKEIAEAWGLEYNVEDTKKVWEALPQGGKTDFEFLNYLSYIEDSGNYIFFVNGKTLNFVRRGYNKEADVAYLIGKSDEVLAFKPEYTEMFDARDSAGFSQISFDPESIEIPEIDTSFDSLKDNISLSDFENAIQGGQYDGLIQNQMSEIPALPEAEIKNMGNSVVKRAGQKQLTAKLTLIGNPIILPNTILTIGGNVVDQDKGNWYVYKVKHIIDTRYITEVELNKNTSDWRVKGTPLNSTPAKVSTGTVNDTSGAPSESLDNTAVVYVYDTQGELIGGKTADNRYIQIGDK